MTNYIYSIRDKLKHDNYVRFASSENDYWVDFTEGKINRLKEKHGAEFNLIVIGSEEDDGDYYIIPFRVVEQVFNNESIYKGSRRRWIASITSHTLSVRNSEETVDVRRFYGAQNLLGDLS